MYLQVGFLSLPATLLLFNVISQMFHIELILDLMYIDIYLLCVF